MMYYPLIKHEFHTVKVVTDSVHIENLLVKSSLSKVENHVMVSGVPFRYALEIMACF